MRLSSTDPVGREHAQRFAVIPAAACSPQPRSPAAALGRTSELDVLVMRTVQQQSARGGRLALGRAAAAQSPSEIMFLSTASAPLAMDHQQSQAIVPLRGKRCTGGYLT